MSDGEAKFFWCGWNLRTGVPQEEWLEHWPDGMKGWCTGSGEGYNVYAGRVTAENPEKAWNVVLSCYAGQREYVISRWTPYVYDGKPSERFPD